MSDESLQQRWNEFLDRAHGEPSEVSVRPEEAPQEIKAPSLGQAMAALSQSLPLAFEDIANAISALGQFFSEDVLPILADLAEKISNFVEEFLEDNSENRQYREVAYLLPLPFLPICWTMQLLRLKNAVF